MWVRDRNRLEGTPVAGTEGALGVAGRNGTDCAEAPPHASLPAFSIVA